MGATLTLGFILTVSISDGYTQSEEQKARGKYIEKIRKENIQNPAAQKKLYQEMIGEGARKDREIETRGNKKLDTMYSHIAKKRAENFASQNKKPGKDVPGEKAKASKTSNGTTSVEHSVAPAPQSIENGAAQVDKIQFQKKKKSNK